MAKPRIRAIDPVLAVSARDLQRDRRRLGQKLAAACRKPDALGVASWVLASVAWRFPALVDVAALGGIALGWLAWRLPVELPFKLPERAGRLDPHEREPGTDRPLPARGLLYVGNDRCTGEELYLSDEDARTHFLLLGGTGAGKTAAMVGLTLGNALLWGSGCTYVDGKGDASLWTTFFAMARACGREDDLYVLNYLTGSTDVDPEAQRAERLSNTFNPFLYGSADALTQMLVAQMAEAGGDAATWKDKAIALLTAYVRTLVAMRDRGCNEHGQPFVLDVGALRAYLPLDPLIDLYLRARDRVDGFALPAPALEALQSYLESVPGFQDPARLLEAQQQTLTPEHIRARAYPPQPDPQTYLQHGYLQNQFNRMFGQLADVYGHIFRVGHGEIDLTDVVLQRRILVVMLPALEKSPDELASLGKLLIAGLKTMLAIGLGARLEGTHRTVIERRPTAAPAPYFGAFDEYGYYAVKGFAVVPAQARSLGFAVCFGGQDLQSFGKESQEEAAAIVGNTLTKCAMRIEDPKETMDLFEKAAGQVLAAQANQLARNGNLLVNAFSETPAAQMDARARIDPLDVREQGPGEAHILRGSTLVRANLFFVGRFRAREYRLNRFVSLGPPDKTELAGARTALTPEGVRRAVGRATETVLEPLQLAAVRALVATLPEPGRPPPDAAGRGRHTFAERLVAEYLRQHARADAVLAARFQAADEPWADPDRADRTAPGAAPGAPPPERSPVEWTSAFVPDRTGAEGDEAAAAVEAMPERVAPIPSALLDAAIVAATMADEDGDWGSNGADANEVEARAWMDRALGDDDPGGWIARRETGDAQAAREAGPEGVGGDPTARALDLNGAGKAPQLPRRVFVVDRLEELDFTLDANRACLADWANPGAGP